MATHTALDTNDTVTTAKGHFLKHLKYLKPLGFYISMYQFAIEKIAVAAPNAGNTLLRLLARVENENQIYFHAAQMAEIFKMPRSTLMNHFNELVRAGAIVPDPKQEKQERGIVLWRVCPMLAWRGKPEAMREYLAALPSEHPFWQFVEPAFLPSGTSH